MQAGGEREWKDYGLTVFISSKQKEKKKHLTLSLICVVELNRVIKVAWEEPRHICDVLFAN